MGSDTERPGDGRTDERKPCRLCGGSGRIALGGFNCSGLPKPGLPMDCPACQGSGRDSDGRRPLVISGRLPGPGDEIDPGVRLADDCVMDVSALRIPGVKVLRGDGKGGWVADPLEGGPDGR